MKQSRRSTVPLIGRTVAGLALAGVTVAVPFTASAQSTAPSQAPEQADCLLILCPDDGLGIDLDLDLDLDILGGADDPVPPPAPTTTATPTTTPAPPSTSPRGSALDDIIDVDVDLGLDAEVGDVAVVDATVPVDVEVGSRPGRPLAVHAETSPDASATVLPGSDRPLADVDVSDVDVTVDAIVPGGGATSPSGSNPLGVAEVDDLSCLVGLAIIDTSGATCSGGALVGLDPGVAGVGLDADICNVSVVVLGSAERAACATDGDDPTTDDPGDDPTTDDPGDDPTTDDPGDDPTTDDPGDDPGDDPNVGVGDDSFADGSGGPFGARRSEQAQDTQDADLAVTGTSVLVVLLMAAAATSAGVASLAIKRRRPTA